MARFSSLCAHRPLADDRTHLHCFERFFTNRCEEVNNYSGWMTRSFCDGSSRFAYRRVDTRQDRSVPHRIAGRVQMDTVDGVMFGHGRQSDKAGSGLLGELRQDRVVAVDRRTVSAFIATALLSCVQVVSGDNAARLLAIWSAETWLVKIKRLTAAAACSRWSASPAVRL